MKPVYIQDDEPFSQKITHPFAKSTVGVLPGGRTKNIAEGVLPRDAVNP